MTTKEQQLGPFCQSCGMPLQAAEDFGMAAEGYRQNDYCHFCYTDGKFNSPDVTLEEMIEQVIPFAAQATGMSEAEVRTMTEETLPRLKRWS